MPTLAIAAGIGAVGSIASGAIGSSAAGHAADTQAQAAEYAADLQKQASDKALAETQRQYDTGQGNLAPWLQAGRYGLSDLVRGMGMGDPNAPMSTAATPVMSSAGYQLQNQISDLQQRRDELSRIAASDPHKTESSLNEIRSIDNQLVDLNSQYQTEQSAAASTAATTTTPSTSTIGFGELNAPFTYDPNADPSTQFRLKQGEESLSRSAAAKGMPFGGTAAKAITEYGQEFASQEYDKSYQRYQSEQANRFNRLAAIAGVGQTAAAQSTAAGQNYANSVSDIYQNSATAQGTAAERAAQARASGYVESSNAWGNAIGGAANNIFGGLYLSGLYGNQGSSGSNQTSIIGDSFADYKNMYGL